MSSESQAIPEPSFAWDAERRFPLLFGGFIALSIFAHIAAFFIFQVTYPAHVTIPPPAAQITVLSADVPEHRGLLAWVAAEDPALAGAVSKAKPPGAATVPYKASFDMVRTWPHRAPAGYEDVPMPAGLSGFEFITARKLQAPEPRQNPVAETRLEISGPLAARTMSGTFAPQVRSSTALTPTRFMIGVDGQGRVQHVFVQESSGEASVDEAATRAVKTLQFSPVEDTFTWGFVSVAWGDDVLIADVPKPVSQP